MGAAARVHSARRAAAVAPITVTDTDEEALAA
jgi:hypothetical protein